MHYYKPKSKMSTNHQLSSEGWWSMDSPAPPSHNSFSWLSGSTPQYPASAPMNAVDLNNEEEEEEVVNQHATETLFEKPLTPSDVGKLNRLVIPKQHAEKHFPLNATADSGLLLGFEDEVGKSWRFRYSYWNSSQSYVLTKGWSRFVKEKRLHAGDIVIFSRHRLDTGRLFIGWRRRNSPSSQPPTGGWGTLFCSAQIQPSQSHSHSHAGGSGVPSSASGNSKRLIRLFGVNLECHATDDSEPSTPLGSPHQHPYHQQYYSSNHHMDMSFSEDVYRQG